MYRVKCILKNGVAATIAMVATLEEADDLLNGLELNMMDPTISKIVFRNGYRMVAVKDISAVWVEEGEDVEDSE